jgi:hypothetical protein
LNKWRVGSNVWLSKGLVGCNIFSGITKKMIVGISGLENKVISNKFGRSIRIIHVQEGFLLFLDENWT